MYKSKDDENISRTMQDKKMEQKKSGIYMDRMDGALPQNRVSKYYQDTNPKMEQEYTGNNPIAKRMHAEAKTKAAAKAKKDAENKANDSIFNDSANDGNMVSRALRKAESYLPGPSGQGGNTTFGISKKL